MSPAPAVASPWTGAGAARVRIDQGAARGCIVLRDEPLDGDGREGRIGIELRAILERELLRLEEQMQVLGAAPLERAEIEPLEDVQHLQDGDALAVRRQLEHAPAAIRRRNRLDPLGAVRAKVLAAEIAAVAADALLDGGRDGAVVKPGAAFVRDQLVRAREPQIRERLADRRRAAAGHEDLGEAGVAMKLARAGRPCGADDLGHREALARVFDRRREQLAERQAPEARVQLAPAVDGARHADGERARARGSGRDLKPRSRSSVSDSGERPLAFKPCSRPVAASETIANKSPPMPQLVGSVSPSAAFAAIAASTALPPRRSVATPISVASGWLVATMPWRAMTTERVAKRSVVGPHGILVASSRRLPRRAARFKRGSPHATLGS